MNRIRTRQLCGMCAGALLLLFVAIVPSAIAKQKPETPADSLTVVAQLPLPRVSVSQIFLQGHGTSSSCTSSKLPRNQMTSRSHLVIGHCV
jgi:hypothetical protein